MAQKASTAAYFGRQLAAAAVSSFPTRATQYVCACALSTWRIPLGGEIQNMILTRTTYGRRAAKKDLRTLEEQVSYAQVGVPAQNVIRRDLEENVKFKRQSRSH